MNRPYELVFLLEEPSIKEMLKIILPKIIPEHISFLCIPHQGKQDLAKSIPRKLQSFPPYTKFIILHDKDSNDCVKLKQELQQLCDQNNQSNTLIRIVCHELESWYLGDMTAVEKAFNLKAGKLTKLQNKVKFRNPDKLSAPKQELKSLVPEYQQISGSRAIANFLALDCNKSHSFNVFIAGLKKLIQEIDSPV